MPTKLSVYDDEQRALRGEWVETSVLTMIVPEKVRLYITKGACRINGTNNDEHKVLRPDAGETLDSWVEKGYRLQILDARFRLEKAS